MSVGYFIPQSVQGEWFQQQRAARAERTRTSSKRRIVLPVCLFFVLLAQLWVRISIINAGYELEQLREQVLTNDERLRAARLEWAMKTRPLEVMEVAKRKLGMIPLTPQYIRTGTWGEE